MGQLLTHCLLPCRQGIPFNTGFPIAYDESWLPLPVLADSLADAADPQHWLASLAPQYTDAEFAMLDKACSARASNIRGRTLQPHRRRHVRATRWRRRRLWPT